VGVTGLLLSGFVFTHVLGNFLIFVGPQAYNMYSHALISNPAIYVAEALLLIFFIAHLGIAIRLSFENSAARPEKYAVVAKGEKATSAVTKGMWAQGVIILVFTVLHLITFKFGPYYTVNYDGVEVRDLFRLVVEVFQSPVYVVGYVFALIVLGAHLSHGVSSAFQTLGFHHPKYTPCVKRAGLAFALFVSLGFISQPLYVFFVHKG
jgi:succinate dehydrogenase / fumarate reductase cytochrome b subunit